MEKMSSTCTSILLRRENICQLKLKKSVGRMKISFVVQCMSENNNFLPYLSINEPRHEKTNKISVRPAKTLPSLIRVFAGRTLSLLVLSCRGSNATAAPWRRLRSRNQEFLVTKFISLSSQMKKLYFIECPWFGLKKRADWSLNSQFSLDLPLNTGYNRQNIWTKTTNLKKEI